jgi:hypothetical protein
LQPGFFLHIFVCVRRVHDHATNTSRLIFACKCTYQATKKKHRFFLASLDFIALFISFAKIVQCHAVRTGSKSFSHSFIMDTAYNILQGRLSYVSVLCDEERVCNYFSPSPPAPRYFYADFGSDPAKATLHLSLSHLSQYSKCKWHKITQPRFFSCSEPEFVQTDSQLDVPTRQPRLNLFLDRLLGSLNVYKYGLRNFSVVKIITLF